MNFKEYADVFSASINATNGSGQIEIRQDSPAGLLLGVVDIPKMKNQNNFMMISGKISEVVGIKDIYLVFKGKTKGRFDLDWFSFSE